MLFNSYEFILAFLPITLLGFLLLGRFGDHRYALGWLVLASLFFYGWWNPAYLLLIGFSIAFNYMVGFMLGAGGHWPGRKALLIFGIAVNLGLIGYFKYFEFLLTNTNAAFGTNFFVEHIVLPLAISFFTFQQITYLVDSYQQQAREISFLRYCLFVTFFPQLIAGPIVHHGEMLPQFAQAATYRLRFDNLAIGVTIFSFGLFKKAVLADGVAVYATPVFDDALAGGTPDLFTAWGAALAYTLQLYFDFSGYSDMAIGAARMFGIVLPLNFFSPYKATSIIDFWRRWHMTLSRFLRDYVYIPLGGNRQGHARRYGNLMATMLLGGLWHGAGWTFVLWGALHGGYLMINHAWDAAARRLGIASDRPGQARRFAGWLLTFLAVVVAWVLFRAESLDAALRMLEGMAGLNGVSVPAGVALRLGPVAPALETLGVELVLGGGEIFVNTCLWVAALLAIAVLMPNTQQVMQRCGPALAFDRIAAQLGRGVGPDWRAIVWSPSVRWATVTAAATVLGILALPEVTEFLYFQF